MADDAIGATGQVLTVSALMSAMERIRNSCPACGGDGFRISETTEHFVGRMAGYVADKGYFTVGESMVLRERCRACDGTGLTNG